MEPFPVNGMADDFKGVSTSGAEFGENDNMVFIMDNDPAKKTFDIPMYVEGTVSGPSSPNTLQFDAVDGAGDNLGTSDRWTGHRFADYRCWFQAKGFTPFSTPNTRIRIRSQQFGDNGPNILFGIFNPSTPQSETTVSYVLDAANNDILISALLGGGNERSIGLTSNAPVEVTVTGPSSGLYSYDVQFITPVNLNTVLVGDIINLTDPNFSTANQGPMAVTVVTNLSDINRSFEHLQEDFAGGIVGTNTSVDLGSAPSQALEVGDKIVASSITKQASATTVNTVDVPTGGAYAAGGGTFVSNATTFTYTSYASGTFSGVTPDPTAIIGVGDDVVQSITPVTRLITVVNTAQTADVAGPGFDDGDGWDLSVIHKAITADVAPSFTVAVGDKIFVASQLLNVTGIVSPTVYHVDNTFAFSGLNAGIVSRIILTAEKTTAGVNETVTMSSSQGVRVYPLAGATANDLISAINNTAGVKDLIFAANAPSNNGAGTITTTTETELADGNLRFRLQNGESFVYASQASNPCFQLKNPSEVAPEIGDVVRFIPMTPLNIKDHFSRKQISGLSIAADVELVNGARRVQVASKVPGADGQVFAVGGKASGNNALAIRGSSQELSASVGVLQTDRSGLSLLAPGQTVFVHQTGRSRKAWVGSTPISSTQAEIQTVTPGVGRLLFGVNLASIRTYTHTGSVVWAVRKLTRTRVRYEVISGTATLPGALLADDWVLVGNGSTYAGQTPLQVFSGANQGYFQVRETDNSTYFDVDNSEAAEEFITAASKPFLFMPYASVIPGDQISIGADAPFTTPNKGTFTITAVTALAQVDYVNANVEDEGPFAIGTQGVDAIRVIDQGFSTYRKITAVTPNPNDPTNFGQVVVTPGYNISIINEDQVGKIAFPNRLGYTTDPVPGIPGYQYWTGLKQAVQRTIDGFAPNVEEFEGVRAGGVSIEVREPQIQRVTLKIKVKTKENVALPSIIDPIKSNIVGFVNSLGLGKDVVLSEIVSIVQSTAGVEAVILISPTLDQERITISDKAVPRTTPLEISIS